MDEDHKQSDEQELLKAWQEYGKRFSVFVSEEQPLPLIWEPGIPGSDEKGRIDRDALKHWEKLFPTRDFLRERYAKYEILQGPSLNFDCLVRKFQPRMHHRKLQDEHGDPLHVAVNDSYEWYGTVLRIGIFHWQVGFSCRSVLCQRVCCKLNLQNPDRMNSIDTFSLIDLFERCGLPQAILHVEKGFGVKTQPFESSGAAPVQRFEALGPGDPLGCSNTGMAEYGNGSEFLETSDGGRPSLS